MLNCLFTFVVSVSEPVSFYCCQLCLTCSLSRRTDSVRCVCYQFGCLSDLTFAGYFFRVSSLSGLSGGCFQFLTGTCFDPVVANIFSVRSCPGGLVWICITVTGSVNFQDSFLAEGFFSVFPFNRACLYQTHSNRIMFHSFCCQRAFCIFLAIKGRSYFQFRIRFMLSVASWLSLFLLSFKTELSLSDYCESKPVLISPLRVSSKLVSARES